MLPLPSPHPTDLGVYVVFLELVTFIFCTVTAIPRWLAFLSSSAIFGGHQWSSVLWAFFSLSISDFFFFWPGWVSLSGNFLKKGSQVLPLLLHPHLGSHVPCAVRAEQSLAVHGCTRFHFIITECMFPPLPSGFCCCSEASEVIRMAPCC